MSGSLTVDRMTVGDAMHTGIVACDVHAPLGAVARMMAAHRIHCVVVRNSAMEWTDPGAGLWGVISDLDLVRLVATDAVAGRTAARARQLRQLSSTSATPYRRRPDSWRTTT